MIGNRNFLFEILLVCSWVLPIMEACLLNILLRPNDLWAPHIPKIFQGSLCTHKDSSEFFSNRYIGDRILMNGGVGKHLTR